MRAINRIRARMRALRKPRQCLHCGKPFLSSGPGNRRCSKCSKDLAHVIIREPMRCFLESGGFAKMRDSDLVQDLVGAGRGTVAKAASTEEN